MEWLGLSVEAFGELIQFLTKKSRTNNIHKKLVLREIRDNLILLKHAAKADADLWAIVVELQTTALEKAIEGGFRFSSLKHGGIPVKVINALGQSRGQRYVGWTAERLLLSIEGKIKEMKRLPRIYKNPHTKSINLLLRLSNLSYQLQLLTVFLKSS